MIENAKLGGQGRAGAGIPTRARRRTRGSPGATLEDAVVQGVQPGGGSSSQEILVG